MRAFVQMREQIAANEVILKRLAEIDKSLLKHDKSLQVIWSQLQPLLAPPPNPPKTAHRLRFGQEVNPLKDHQPAYVTRGAHRVVVLACDPFLNL